MNNNHRREIQEAGGSWRRRGGNDVNTMYGIIKREKERERERNLTSKLKNNLNHPIKLLFQK